MMHSICDVGYIASLVLGLKMYEVDKLELQYRNVLRLMEREFIHVPGEESASFHNALKQLQRAKIITVSDGSITVTKPEEFQTIRDLIVDLNCESGYNRMRSCSDSVKEPHGSRSLTVSFDGTNNESSTNNDSRGSPKGHARKNPFKRSSPMKKRRKEEQREERVSFDVSITWDDSNANDPFSNERVYICSGVVPVRVTGQQRHEGLQAFLKVVGTDLLEKILCHVSKRAEGYDTSP
ncbi:hypothetical protein TELCIR_12317 [Teladorsagia circumcincta]|uniref:Uncharacterized protein n=1 Tax=Teladorsagia circumcincta TaxID=45464 RepID=A0A2G9U6U6_TELCI|nr:hypothetical protein TELCIR_12317 [Teladorsagia circumcincta]